MSTSIPGITDYVPQVQPFRPDLDLYSNVLQVKQSQYDSAFNQMSSVYSSILNSPMLRESNNMRRDQFLKNIDSQIKKIAGTDLSKRENVDLANRVFQPFYEDKYIIHDIAYTKKYQNEMNKAEMYRNCIDPDKCGGTYWEKGVQALNLHAEEYKNADAEGALGYNSPRYAPFINVNQKAIDAAKKAGFNIELDHKEKGYIVTDKNGQLLLGPNNDGPLPQFLYGIFGQDPAVLDMFNTEAYVQRKMFAKQNANQFGSEDAAESYYLNTYINKAVPTLEKNAKKAQQLNSEIDLKKKIIQEQISQTGGLIPGSDQESALELLDALAENKEAATAYHDNILNEIKTAPNLNDLKALRARADSIVANTLLQGSLNSAAYQYAMGTAKTEMKADPYSLESFKTGQDIYKHKQNAMFDLEVWKQQKSFEKEEGIGPYAQKGKGPMDINTFLKRQGLDPAKMSNEDYQKAVDRVTSGDLAQPFVAAGGAKTLTGYEENRNTYMSFIPQVAGQRKDQLVNAIEVMKAKFTTLQQQNQPDSGAKAKQIEHELNSILAGTGISAIELLNGAKDIRGTINGKNDVSVASSFGKMTALMNDVTSLWGNDIKNSASLKKTIQDQTSLNMLGQNLSQQMDKALDEVKKNNLVAGIVGKDMEGSKVIDKMYGSMVGKGGLFIPEDKAASNYATKRVREDIAAFEKSLTNGVEPAYDINEQQLFKKYEGEFKGAYKGLRSAIESKINSFNSPFESPNTGGAQAAMNSMAWNVSSVNPNITNLPATRIADAFGKGNTGIVFAGTNNSLEDLENDPALTQTLKSYLQQYASNAGRGTTDVGFTMSAEIVNPMKYDDGDNAVQAGVVYKISLNPDGAKKLFGRDFDPAKDYSYNVFYPEGQDPNQMYKKSQGNVTDIAMRIKGNALTTPVDNGFITVTNNGDHFGLSGSIKYYNPYKNAMDVKQISDQAPLSTNPSDLIQQNVNVLNSISQSLKPKFNGPGR